MIKVFSLSLFARIPLKSVTIWLAYVMVSSISSGEMFFSANGNSEYFILALRMSYYPFQVSHGMIIDFSGFIDGTRYT